MASLREIVIDSLMPSVLARFWADALDGYGVRPYDDGEVARLASQGYTPETDPAVAIDGPGPTIFFQRTERGKEQRNRIHLDLQTHHREAEVARLSDLGARVRDVHDGFTVMLDPEGNEFCVTDPRD